MGEALKWPWGSPGYLGSSHGLVKGGQRRGKAHEGCGLTLGQAGTGKSPFCVSGLETRSAAAHGLRDPELTQRDLMLTLVGREQESTLLETLYGARAPLLLLPPWPSPGQVTSPYSGELGRTEVSVPTLSPSSPLTLSLSVLSCPPLASPPTGNRA